MDAEMEVEETAEGADGAASEKAPEEIFADVKRAEENIPDETIAENKTSNELASENVTPEEKVAEKDCTEEKTPEGINSDKKIAEEKNADDEAAVDIPEENGAEEDAEAEGEAASGGGVESVSDDPNFAVVCAFLKRFGPFCGIPACPSIAELQAMIESEGEVSQSWILFHVQLLRKLKKTVPIEKWERCVVKFAYTYSYADGWELERTGYKKAKKSLRLRIIKALLEAQLDKNPKLKSEIHQKSAKDLRMQPLGSDKMGNVYWYQVDDEANIRVYKEDLDEETWELVARSKKELEALIEHLKRNPTFVQENKASEEVMPEEDSMQDYANIIRDTGPVLSESMFTSNATSLAPSVVNSEDEASDSEEKKSVTINGKSDAASDASKMIASEDTPDNKPTPEQEELPESAEVELKPKQEEAPESELKSHEHEQMANEQPTPVKAEDSSNVENVSTTQSSLNAQVDETLQLPDVNKMEDDSFDVSLQSFSSTVDENIREVDADSILASETVSALEDFSQIALVSNPAVAQANDVELGSVIGSECMDIDGSLPSTNEMPASEVLNPISERSLNEPPVEEGARLNASHDNEKNVEAEAQSIACEDTVPDVPAENGVTNSSSSEKINSSDHASDPPKSDSNETRASSAAQECPANNVDMEPNKVGEQSHSSLPQETNSSDFPSHPQQSENNEASSQNPAEDRSEKNEDLGLGKANKTVHSILNIIGSSSPEESVKSSDDISGDISLPPAEVGTAESSAANGETAAAEAEPHDDRKRQLDENDPDEASAKKAKVAEAVESVEDAIGEAIEEPVMIITGRGSGAACEARNTRVGSSDTANNTNGVKGDSAEAETEANLPTKGSKHARASESEDEEENGDDDSESEEDAPKKKRGKKQSNADDAKLAAALADEEPSSGGRPMRASGRIAAQRIKETERRQREEADALEAYKKKKSKKEGRKGKKGKKSKYDSDSDEDSEEEEGEEEEETGKKKRRRRRKKKKKKRGEENLREFAKFSSGSDEEEGQEEAEEYENEEEEDDLFKSDHEFSCESDVPDEEAQPIKHARTATKKGKGRKKKEAEVEAEELEEEDDDFACKKCDKSDHPEWILLCDKCDNGWHASCLRPSLMVIPEGNWFCPECQHADLLQCLQDNLLEYDSLVKKKDADTKRKERLAFVSLSLSNILPASTAKKAPERPPRKPRRPRDDDSESSASGSSSASGGASSSEEESSEEDEDQGLGHRRRAARNVTYNTKEYDEMIKSALADEEEFAQGEEGGGKDIDNLAGDEEEEAEEEEEEEDVLAPTGVRSGQGRGKDIENILQAGEEEEEGEEKAKKDEEDETGNDNGEASGPKPIRMNIKKSDNSKKKKKLSDLNMSESDYDNDTGSDYEASEASWDEDEEPEEEFLDDEDENPSEEELDSEAEKTSSKKRKSSYIEPARRSGRSRKVIYDSDFVIDGSGSEDDDDAPLSKKRKKDDESFDEDEEDDDEEDYGRSKKKKSKGKSKSSSSKKKKSSGGSSSKKAKKQYEDDDSDFESKARKRKKKLLDEPSSSRRTRGKQVSYSWAAESGSSDEEEASAPKSRGKKKRKRDSDSEDDYDDQVEAMEQEMAEESEQDDDDDDD